MFREHRGTLGNTRQCVFPVPPPVGGNGNTAGNVPGTPPQDRGWLVVRRACQPAASTNQTHTRRTMNHGHQTTNPTPHPHRQLLQLRQTPRLHPQATRQTTTPPLTRTRPTLRTLLRRRLRLPLLPLLHLPLVLRLRPLHPITLSRSILLHILRLRLPMTIRIRTPRRLRPRLSPRPRPRTRRPHRLHRHLHRHHNHPPIVRRNLPRYPKDEP